jgi:hypothetical protein
MLWKALSAIFYIYDIAGVFLLIIITPFIYNAFYS